MCISHYKPICYSENEPALAVIYAFLLMPFLSNYVFIGPISIGDLLFLLVVFPWLCYNMRRDVTVLAQLLICVFFVVFSLLIYAMSDKDDYLWQVLRTSFYFASFYIIAGQSYFSYHKFFRHYTYLGIFFSASIILQWAVYHFFGMSVPLQLPLSHYEPDTLNVISHVYRSGGFFKEPSYFSIYVTPLIFYFASEQRYFPLLFLVVAGVMSTSTLFLFIFLVSFVFLPRRIVFIITILIIFTFLTAVNFIDGVFNKFVFIERFISIFVDGGTLTDRFFPVLKLLSSSSYFYSEEAVSYLKNSGFWFSSLGSIMSTLGFISVIYIMLSFYRYGFTLGCVLVIYLFTTHYMSGVYSSFVFFAIFSLHLLLREKKYESKNCIS